MKQEQALEEEQDRQLEQEQAEDAQLDQLQTNDPDRYHALYEQAKAQLYAEFPNLARLAAGRQDSRLHDGAIRSAMKQTLKQNSQHATPPASGQADRLPETESPSAFAESLHTMLLTPKLPAPLQRSAASAASETDTTK